MSLPLSILLGGNMLIEKIKRGVRGFVGWST